MKRIVLTKISVTVALTCLVFNVPADEAALRASNAARNAAMEPIKDDPRLPRVLLIGDSIAMGYTLPLRKLLAGKANVHYPHENCHTSEQILAKLDVYLGANPWDVIQFNCGLHDLTRTNMAGKTVTNGETGVLKVPLEHYQKNLGEIIARLKRTGAELIWCTTTPVTDGLAYRRADDIQRYNAAAKEVMRANGIPITDLFAAASRNGKPKWVDAGHFTVEGTREQAREILPTMQAALAKRPAKEPASLSASRPNAMKAARQEAANRRRRVIFNNDGGETAVEMRSPSAKEFLDLRTTALAGTQVDSIFYCTRTSGFGLFTHDTKVGQVFTSLEGRYTNNQTPAMLKAGLDPLRLIADFGKQHRMEVFWSMRMNDTHDGSRTDYGPITFRTNTLKMTHPEYLMGTAEKRPKIGAFSAVNYALPEIRELAFRYIEEVCKNYDVDGIEMDFYRHPIYFKSNTRGERATDGERALMTGLLQRIRAMADDVGRSRGRPILIAVHCPDSAEFSRDMGLDIENWMANDLLDIWIPGGTFHFNPWEYSVGLARKYGVKVYPSLDDPRVKEDTAKQMRMSPATYRARATEVWASGADGVYMFNAPDAKLGADNSIWNELGDASKLANLDKDYFASYLGSVGSAGGNLPLPPHITLELLDPTNLKPVNPGKATIARLNIPEDLTKAGSAKLKLRLRFKSPPDAKQTEVSLNGKQLKLLQADGEWLNYSVTPKVVRRGENKAEVKLSADAKKKTDWSDMLLEVRH